MKFYIVDVFGKNKYSGNQLGVFILDKNISKKKMQKLAKEFNFSEVTFIDPIKINDSYNVRIFTPDREVPFAGHPTLGSAFIINEILENSIQKKIKLFFDVGEIPVDVTNNYYEMKQNQPKFKEFYNRSEISKIVSLTKKDIKKSFPIQNVSTGLDSIIIPIKNKETLKKATINHNKYSEFLKKNGNRNLILFTKDKDNIICRVFVDDLGYGEDPATGSANGNLAAYLLKYHFFGSKESISYKVKQGSQIGRPSELFVKASYNNGYDIRVGGYVFLVAQGDLE